MKNKKNKKQHILILFILSLIIPSKTYTQDLNTTNAQPEQELDHARQVDPSVDAAAQSDKDDAGRVTEVEVSTPLVYLKMLSDDPVGQAVIGLFGAVVLIVMVQQIYTQVAG